MSPMGPMGLVSPMSPISPTLLDYSLDPRVTAFSTTRQGGYSQGLYGQLNINAFCGDAPEAVAKNRQLLADSLGLKDVSRLIIPHQVHLTEICQIDPSFLSRPAADRQALLEGIDAVITNVVGVCIGVSTADCIPVILYDPCRHCAAAIHAGWRGTVSRIVEKTIDRMADAYHCQPAEMKAIIGPGISRKNFEVGDEVYDRFRQEGFDMQQIAERRSKWHIDLPLCNQLQLQSKGLLPENIHDAAICTYDQSDRFFSARRLGIRSGRIYTAILLKA